MIKNLGVADKPDTNEEQKFAQTVAFRLMKPPIMHTEFYNLVDDLKALSLKLNKRLSINKNDTQDNYNLFYQLKKDIVNAIEAVIWRGRGQPFSALLEQACPDCNLPIQLHILKKGNCAPFNLRKSRISHTQDAEGDSYPFYIRPSLDFTPFVSFEPAMSEGYLKNLI